MDHQTWFRSLLCLHAGASESRDCLRIRTQTHGVSSYLRDQETMKEQVFGSLRGSPYRGVRRGGEQVGDLKPHLIFGRCVSPFGPHNIHNIRCRIISDSQGSFLYTTARILIANRDEYLARPTEPASFHSFHHETEWKVVSGIDSKGGGTWLGINRTGRIAVL